MNGKLQVFARVLYMPSEAMREQLNGIIPVCAHCGQWRDEQGLWRNVSIFIQRDEQLQFSHGICPACLKKHYPDVFREMVASEQMSKQFGPFGEIDKNQNGGPAAAKFRPGPPVQCEPEHAEGKPENNSGAAIYDLGDHSVSFAGKGKVR